MAEKVQRQKGVSLTWLAALPVLLAAAFTAYPDVLGKSGPEPAPSVTIKQGTIIGKFVDDGTFPKPLEGFMGIPYAVPPVGERRFKHAEPVGASNETIEAYYLGPRYVSYKNIYVMMLISEDVLEYNSFLSSKIPSLVQTTNQRIASPSTSGARKAILQKRGSYQSLC